MKIGIDARVLDRRMTGTGRYLKNLLDGIPKVDNRNEYFVFINDSSLIDTRFYEQVRVRESRLPDKFYSSYWLNFILPGETKKYDLDIFFTCNIILPFVTLGKTKMVTVIHDIIQKAEPSFYPFSYRTYLNVYLPYTIKHADIILTASGYSKTDILKYFPSAKNKTEVLYTSAEGKFKVREIENEKLRTLKLKYDLTDRYVLYVGVIEKRKNIEGLFKVAKRINERNSDFSLVMVGRPGFGFKDIDEKAKITGGAVNYINFVDEEDLPLIYNAATIFLFPSYYEGFGIPPLEAMQSGVPVISSKLTSLSEVLGEAAIMVEPNDTNKIVDEIIKLNEDKKYYEYYKNLGLERAKEFNYLNSAKKLVEIFNKLKD